MTKRHMPIQYGNDADKGMPKTVDYVGLWIAIDTHKIYCAWDGQWLLVAETQG